MLDVLWQRRAEIAVQATQAACQIVLDVYATQFSVDYKTAREPVTLADRKANAVICEAISKSFPSDGLVAEESLPANADDLEEQVTRDVVWFVDPLDGTKEFIARNGEFAVMVGCAHAGRAVLGVIGTPATGEIWVGAVGNGAWRIDPSGKKQRLCVSDVSDLAQARLLVSRSHKPDKLLQIIERMPHAAQVACGSAGVKCARIACGQADLYVNPYQPGGAKLWDGCAPEALACAAGGCVTDTKGHPIQYGVPNLELAGGFVASAPAIHDAVIAITSEF